MELKRVVVTGIGAITPLGLTAEESWENLKKGVKDPVCMRGQRIC